MVADLADSTAPLDMSASGCEVERVDAPVGSVDGTYSTENVTDRVAPPVVIETMEPIAFIAIESVERVDAFESDDEDYIEEGEGYVSHGVIDESAVFMIGRCSRYGRAVKVANRLY